MTRHLLPLPGRPDTSSVARWSADSQQAARLIEAQVQRGNTLAAQLQTELFGAHPLDRIYIEQREQPRSRVLADLWPLIAAAIVISVLLCWWAVR